MRRPLLGAFVCLFDLAFGQVNVLTFHNSVRRTGVNAAEAILTTSNVNYSSFGKRFFLQTDGRVDAQPLYVSSLQVGGGAHNVVFVAT